MSDSTPSEKVGLLPTLGLFTTISIVVGAVIGSGIFKKSAPMALQLGSPELLIGVWILAGILTLFGALTNAEVAGMISATGGQYIFFKEMYGKFSAYLYGWAMFAVVQSGSIASITYIFSESANEFLSLPHLSPAMESMSFHIRYIGDIFPFADIGVKGLTIAIIILLSLINYRGVALGGAVQVIFTVLKVIAIAIIVVLAFTSGGGNATNFVQVSASGTPSGIGLLGAIMAALTGAFWAYDGWNNITYIAGEVKNPQHTIPRSLFVGMMVIISVYLVVNLAYIYVMPIDAMAKSGFLAMDVAKIIFANINPSLATIGVGFIAAAIMISTFGTSNSTILASARLYYAMSREKMFFKSLGEIHPRYRTPGNALLIQAIWSSVLVFSGTFDTLTDMLIFVSWVFYAMGAAGVFILRKKMPDVARPYKVWGYPYIPLLFVTFASAFVIITLYTDIQAYMTGQSTIINSVFGIFLVALGIPFYVYFEWKKKQRAE
ncbi:MAG: amino acid permease [Bacteroidetes bacterium]|nr:amino acid permease [Bacteroidota bacterium]